MTASAGVGVDRVTVELDSSVVDSAPLDLVDVIVCVGADDVLSAAVESWVFKSLDEVLMMVEYTVVVPVVSTADEEVDASVELMVDENRDPSGLVTVAVSSVVDCCVEISGSVVV